MRNVMKFSLCGLALLAASVSAAANTDKEGAAVRPALVDPFTATPLNLERLHTQVMQASLEQELTAKQKAIAANKLVL